MPTHTGYFGQRYASTGWWDYKWRAPIASTADQALTEHNYTENGGQCAYFTSNKSILTMPSDQYPTKLKFSDYGYYSGDVGWRNAKDGMVMESGDVGTATLYLCYGNGQNSYEKK